MTPQDRLRIDAGARHLHALGPRAVADCVADIADALSADELRAMLRLLEVFQRITPEDIQEASTRKAL